MRKNQYLLLHLTYKNFKRYFESEMAFLFSLRYNIILTAS